MKWYIKMTIWWTSGPLFTKKTDVLPQDITKFRSGKQSVTNAFRPNWGSNKKSRFRCYYLEKAVERSYDFIGMIAVNRALVYYLTILSCYDACSVIRIPFHHGRLLYELTNVGKTFIIWCDWWVGKGSRQIQIAVHAPLLTYWGRHNIAAISQTKFSNAFSWMEIYLFCSRFLWSLFKFV